VEHPKDIGDHSTLAVMLALRAAGYGLYIPFGENTRCDLVIDDGSTLARVQCKTGRLKAGAVEFRTCSSYAHHSNPRARFRSYVGEIDYFGVCCRETGATYLVPIEDVPNRRSASIRVDPARNGQHERTRDAARYEIARLETAREAPAARAGGSGSSA
jgi:hypothetical protein